MYSQILHYEAQRHDMQRHRANLERQRHVVAAEEAHAAARPSRPRMALLTWAGAYTVISLILYLLGPYIADWPLLARTAILSGLMVVTLTWGVLPMLTRVFRGWLAT